MFFGGVANCSVLFVPCSGEEGAVFIRLKFFIKTSELTVLLCRKRRIFEKKRRIFEIYFDLIKFSLKSKYYFTENRIRLIVKFLNSKRTVFVFCLHTQQEGDSAWL